MGVRGCLDEVVGTPLGGKEVERPVLTQYYLIRTFLSRKMFLTEMVNKKWFH